jgi:hypothetical protein
MAFMLNMKDMNWFHTQPVTMLLSVANTSTENTMKTLLAAVLFTSLTAFAAPDVKGHWKSAGAEDMGNGSFSTREFTLTNTTWELAFTIYADKELKVPLVAMNFSGGWKTTGASKSVPGASEALFEFKKKTVTLHAKDAAKGFGMDGCGLTVGIPLDVSKNGCSFVTPVATYGKEFDLLKRDGEQLFFGARPADGNMGSEDKRPTALGAPLMHVK